MRDISLPPVKSLFHGTFCKGVILICEICFQRARTSARSKRLGSLYPRARFTGPGAWPSPVKS